MHLLSNMDSVWPTSGLNHSTLRAVQMRSDHAAFCPLSKHHKQSNTFQYKTMTECIGQMDVSKACRNQIHCYRYLRIPWRHISLKAYGWICHQTPYDMREENPSSAFFQEIWAYLERWSIRFKCHMFYHMHYCKTTLKEIAWKSSTAY